MDPEARRPLPAASPASGAGAGLARHLLRIDADTASGASPAPGMQRWWRAGPCWRGGGRDRRGPCLSASAVLPLGVGAGGTGGRLELSEA